MKDTIQARRLVCSLNRRFPGRFVDQDRILATAIYKFITGGVDKEDRITAVEVAVDSVSYKARVEQIIEVAQSVLDWEPNKPPAPPPVVRKVKKKAKTKKKTVRRRLIPHVPEDW